MQKKKGFEKFVNTGRWRRKRGNRLYLRSCGHLSISAGAFKAFGLEGFPAVVLYYDAARKRIGIEPVNSLECEGAVRICNRRGTVTLAAKAFFGYFKISHNPTAGYRLVQDDDTGFLVAELGE